MGRLVNYLKLRSPKLILVLVLIMILFLTKIPRLIFYGISSQSSAAISIKDICYSLITSYFLIIYFYISRKSEQSFMKSLNFNTTDLQKKLMAIHLSLVVVIVLIYLAVMTILNSGTEFIYIFIDGYLLIIMTLIMYNGLSLFKIQVKIRQMLAVMAFLGLTFLITLFGTKYTMFSLTILLIILVNNIVKNFKSGGTYA